MSALLGLIIQRGILRANLVAIPVLWSGNYGEIFQATMSMNRFSYLLGMLRLDDIALREEAKR